MTQISRGSTHDAGKRTDLFQKRLAKIVAIPWLMATNADFLFPETEGTPDRTTRLAQWYMLKVARAATHSAAVNQAYIEVSNLVRPSTILFRPRILAQVFDGTEPTETMSVPVSNGHLA